MKKDVCSLIWLALIGLFRSRASLQVEILTLSLELALDLATVFCLSGKAQTINVMALNQDGAQTVLQAAKESAQQRSAPSAIAVVDPAGKLLAFQRMDGVRPASADLAMSMAQSWAQ